MKALYILRSTVVCFCVLLVLAAQGYAAIGDNAPPIPSGYNTSHPRLPSPDNTFLTSLANNPTALATYNAVADAWDSTNPGNLTLARRLVIAYMANKIANPTKAATYLAKIKALADLGGSWGALLYSVNDGVGNGSYTLTSASANFLTGCGGSSCVDNVLSIEGRTFIINAVTNATTVVLASDSPAPSGTNLKIRIFGTLDGFAGLDIALIYDWLYNDLDVATRTEFMNELEVLCSAWEENYVGVGASPYNDVYYIRLGTFGLIGALAIYPDHPNGLTHLRFMSDVWFNVMLPVWKQVFGPEGGGWHENWPDYVNAANGFGLTTFLVPSLLSWQNATGDAIFARESWLKNFAYYTMYMTRPDYTMEALGDSSHAYLMPEYNLQIGAGIGSLNGLAEIYNDPVLRGWARTVNNEAPAGPTGYEPSAWPFYSPDNKSKTASSRSALPAVRNFTGWGVLDMRTGWTEDDTTATLKYGDSFWSHEHFDAGAFTIYNRGNLALDSGTYTAGSDSKHQRQYGQQTVAHNTLTITDPADVYPTTFTVIDETGKSVQLAPPNEGGQRRTRSGYNEHFPALVSPFTLGNWLQEWDYYHMGKMIAYSSTPNYTYTAVDITAAYNNRFSATTPNATNRTYRVQKAVRHFLFVPRGTAAYVVVFDQVVSTNATFVKKWLLHTVDQPKVVGNHFEVVRNELVTPLPYSGAWTVAFSNLLKYATQNYQYQYNGKLYGWTVSPQAAKLNVVGGPGKEFWIEDPLNPGTGTNWNQCQYGQCSANIEGLGPVEDQVNPDPTTAPHEPGSWRLEVTPAAPNTQDLFLNVMLATTVGDTAVPANVTVPTGLVAGMVGATWSDGSRNYTISFPQTGVGGHITIAGVVDEELMSQAQQLPDNMQAISGKSQTAAANTAAPGPLVVQVNDSAGNPVPNVVVHYGITQGSGVLSSATATTNNQGQASVNLTLGSGATGSIVSVMADVNGLQPVEFDSTIGSTLASPTLSSLLCSPTVLPSGGVSSCTVTLTQAAGQGGISIAVASSLPALSVPATILIPAGTTTGTFLASAGTVATAAAAAVTATYNGVSQTVTFTIAAGTGSNSVTVTALTCGSGTMTAGSSLSCTVTLSGSAPSGGTSVGLASNTPSLTVPATITVQAGATSASFTATAGTVSSSVTGVVTASYSGSSRTFTVTINPGAASVTLSSLTCGAASLVASTSSSCTVTLSGAAPAGGVAVSLSSSTQSLTVPASVTVAAGSTSGSFTATAGTVSSSVTGVVTASYSGSSQTFTLTVTSGAATVTLSSLTCGAASLVASTSSSCTVTLSGTAPAGGVAVSLSSSTQSLTVPASVTVAAGSTSGSFTATAGTVTGGLTATVTAGYNNGRATFLLTLTPGSTSNLTLTTNKWLQVNTQGFPVLTMGYEKLVYAPAPVKKALMLGNYHMLGSEPNQSMIAYDFEANRWDVLNIGSSFHSEQMPDSGHPVGAFTYDPNQKRIIYYCCSSGSNQPENLNHMWWYDVVGQTGRDKDVPSKPGPVLMSGAAFDPTNNVYVLQGGSSFSGTWVYDPTANTFQQVTTTGGAPDPSVLMPVMTYNSTDHNIYLFGGQAAGVYLNDLFKYNAATRTWTKLNPTGARPAPRWNTSLAYDSTNNVFMVYGGEDASQVYNDSWIYDPAANAWTQLSPAIAPPLGAVGPFDMLVYDSDHNAFILAIHGTGALQTWLFRYQGTGPNPGTAQPTFQPSAGGMNVNTDGWAKEPALASASSGALYTTWVETGKPFDTSNAAWFHVYVSQRSNGTWTPLGGTSSSLDSEFANYSESHSPSVAIINGTPWVSWYKWNNSGVTNSNWKLWAKFWNGSSWQGGVIGTDGTNPSFDFQGRSQMAAIGSVPHIAFLEVNKETLPQKTFVYVKYWNGTQWALKGSAPLNKNFSTNTVASSVSITSDGTNPYVAWTEYTTDNTVQNQTPGQVYVASWNGNGWVSIGGSLNISASNWADNASIAYLAGQPYVAWTERTTGGNAQVFVKTYNGTSWVLVGSGTLNKDSNTGWAFHPTLTADSANNTLYIGWVEQQALGQKAQAYVAKYAAGTWTSLGTSLNQDPLLGSSERVSLAVVGGQIVASWGEVNFGTMRQVFVKQWNGSAWALLAGNPATIQTHMPCDVNGDGTVNSVDVQLAINQALGLATCSTGDVDGSGTCNVIDVQWVINRSLGGSCGSQ